MSRKKTYGRTIKGELITEEFIEEAVKRAEAGYDVEELLTWRDVTPKSSSDPSVPVRNAPGQRPRRR
jgi:hypothetical protein